VAKAGICSVNGTGTVTIGIDDDANFFQVGGTGDLAGDDAGGGYIARQVVKKAYAAKLRAGEKTALLDGVMEMMGLKTPHDMHAFASGPGWGSNHRRPLIQLADRLAQAGDAVAARIFDNAGITCGLGVVGCAGYLNFRKEIVVIKAGTIWNVIGYPGLVDNFTRTVREGLANSIHAALPIRFELLEATPALGALFWAKELIDGEITPAYREEMRRFLSPEKYAELAGT